MVQIAVNVKAKAGLKSSTIVQNSNIYCFKSHCLFNSTTLKVHTQETTGKDSHSEEPKAKKAKPILSRAVEANELSKQARKERMKKKHQEK